MSEQQTVPSDEISLKDFILKIGEWWGFLKSHVLKIAFVALLGGIIGFVYAWMQPINFVAKTNFVVEEGKSGSSSLGGLASIAGQFGVDVSGNSGGGLLSGDNILLYFKSTSLAREVLLSKYDTTTFLSIADVYADVYKLREKWSKDEKIENIRFPPFSNATKYTRLQDSLLQKIVADILDTKFSVVKTDKKAGFIDVMTTMENEELAKTYCEKVVQIAVDRYLLAKTQRQKNTVDKLQARVDSIANLLSRKTSSGAALQTLNSTMDINPLYRTGTAVAVETTLRDKTMLATIFASLTQNLELAKFTLSQETPMIQIVDKPILPLKILKVSKVIASLTLATTLAFFFILFLVLRRIINL